MPFNHLRVQPAPRTPKNFWRINPAVGDKRLYDLSVDGRHISDYFENEPHSLPLGAFTLPHDKEALLQHFEMPEQLRAAFDSRDQHKVLDWSCIAALLGDTTTLPLGKLPILTCCGDELCGYVACTVSYDGNTIAESTTVW